MSAILSSLPKTFFFISRLFSQKCIFTITPSIQAQPYQPPELRPSPSRGFISSTAPLSDMTYNPTVALQPFVANE
jgi:hypothetical protein